jgi:hypothetical protein
MAKSHAAYRRKQAAIQEAQYAPTSANMQNGATLRTAAWRESRPTKERRVKSRKMTRKDRVWIAAKNAGIVDIARLIAAPER